MTGKIPGLKVGGRGGVSHVAKTQANQLATNPARNISARTAGKIAGDGAAESVPEAVASIASGLVTKAIGGATENATIGNAAEYTLVASGCN